MIGLTYINIFIDNEERLIGITASCILLNCSVHNTQCADPCGKMFPIMTVKELTKHC